MCVSRSKIWGGGAGWSLAGDAESPRCSGLVRALLSDMTYAVALIALLGCGVFAGVVRGLGVTMFETTRLVVRNLVLGTEWGDGIDPGTVAAVAAVVVDWGFCFVQVGPLLAVALVPSVDWTKSWSRWTMVG